MLRLQVKTPDDQGYDLSGIAQDLQFSNVRPGGDESCSFTLRRSWLDSNPEVKRGSIVRVLDGLDVLWQGRLEEIDRGSDQTETIAVTAYGLGARLKDGLFRQVFIDRDLNNWVGASRTERINLAAAGASYQADADVSTDTINGLPALTFSIRGAWSIQPFSEAWYDAGSDCNIAAIYLDPQAGAGVALNSAGWVQTVEILNQDSRSGSSVGGSANPTAAGYITPTTPMRFADIFLSYSAGAAGTEDQEYLFAARKLAVYGNHGLTRQGADPGGFTADQLVGYILGLVPGISARLIASGAFVITQFVIDTPTHHEDAIGEAAAFETSTWGTWGPNTVLDRSDQGWFDFSILHEQNEQGEWIIGRADCDDVSLHDELGSLYNKLRINWTDSSGEEFVEIRTAVIPALEEAGLGLNATPREQELDAGPATQATAQQFGDTYFGVQGTDPPSRGSLQLSLPVQHASRGKLPPHYMRADGSAVKIRDALPRSESMSLGRADRRTVFPIQRVSVDASNSSVPQVSVDLDQTPDRLSVIQARMGIAAQALGGGSLAEAPPAAAETQSTKHKKKKGKNKKRKRGGSRRRK